MSGLQQNFLDSLGFALVNSLWQMAMLWIIYQILTCLFFTLKSSLKSWLASGMLISGFILFALTFFISFTSVKQVNSIPYSLLQTIIPGNSSTDQLFTYLPFLAITYLLILAFPVQKFITNFRYVNIIRRQGLSKVDVKLKLFVENIAMHMGITRPVKIWISAFVNSPSTIGFLKPVILIPLAAINHLTPDQLEAILLHELSHIKRHDYLVNLIINFIRTILYFNPFVKAFVKIIEREREKSCDEMVLQFQYDSREYASALLMLEKVQHQTTLTLAASGKSYDLYHRIEALLGIRQKNRFSFNKLAGIIAGLLLFITLNILLFNNSENKKGRSIIFNAKPSARLLTDNIGIEEVALLQKTGPANKNKIGKTAVKNNSLTTKATFPNNSYLPDIINASSEYVALPRLKKYQEEQIKNAMDATRKIFEKSTWERIEKNIAEVLNSKEKEDLKNIYEREIQRMDLNSLEKKLELTYNNIDWDKVNLQLYNTLERFKIDSLQKVYTEVAIDLDNVIGMPDENAKEEKDKPGITSEAIEKKKTEIQQKTRELKSLKKKIVHL
jgi:bla regulator protein blaR1